MLCSQPSIQKKQVKNQSSVQYILKRVYLIQNFCLLFISSLTYLFVLNQSKTGFNKSIVCSTSMLYFQILTTYFGVVPSFFFFFKWQNTCKYQQKCLQLRSILPFRRKTTKLVCFLFFLIEFDDCKTKHLTTPYHNLTKYSYVRFCVIINPQIWPHYCMSNSSLVFFYECIIIVSTHPSQFALY